MTLQLTIAPNGRMSLPADMRKRLGLAHGGAVSVEETPDGIVLRTVGQAVARAQTIARRYADHPDASADAFTTNRKTDSGE